MKKYKGFKGVLLIDDDAATNFIHTKMIERADVDVQVMAINNATDALDFLTYAGKYSDTGHIPRPGVIFLDINMPGLSGWDFMDEYRKMDDNLKARMVVIMLTTSINPADKDRALKNSDISTFLHKPLKPHMVEDLAMKYFEEEL